MKYNRSYLLKINNNFMEEETKDIKIEEEEVVEETEEEL